MATENSFDIVSKVDAQEVLECGGSGLQGDSDALRSEGYAF